jgi:hypothetical protein
MYRNFIRQNNTIITIILFLIIFVFIQLIKPKFLYNNNGSLREFGIGYKNKTILPLWLLSIILGILCYLIIIYYIIHPKLFF